MAGWQGHPSQVVLGRLAHLPGPRQAGELHGGLQIGRFAGVGDESVPRAVCVERVGGGEAATFATAGSGRNGTQGVRVLVVELGGVNVAIVVAIVVLRGGRDEGLLRGDAR